MKRLLFAALYTAAVLGANPGLAETDIRSLREGSMRKLIVHPEPRPAATAAFETKDGTPISLADYNGQYVLLNFWATWCAPCRKEMPDLNALQQEFGGDAFQVVTVATGRQSPAAIRRFFEETGITDLPMHRDPKQKLARPMGVLGLPITVLLDPAGNEIARLQGDAQWHGESARAIIAALIEAKS